VSTADRRGFLRLAGLGAVTAAGAACSGEGAPAPSTGAGTTTTRPRVPSSTPVRPPDWAGLRGRLAGELLLPADPGYDAARRPFNALFADRRPAAVARCERPSDVQACVAVARESRVPVAARSGGHSYAGYSTPEQGLVVDVGGMSGVEVRPDGTAVIGAGARLMDVYTALAEHGRALPAGTCPTVGIAGLTLGGGLGVLNRLHGLTCDRLRSAEVVLPDGTLVVASDRDNVALFWALRGGGGGNIGIVTSFTFDTVPAVDVTVYSLRFPSGSVPGVLGGWQQWITGAPDELWSMCRVSAGTPPGCRVGGCFVGGPAALDPLLDDLVRRAGARPGERFVRAMPHLEAMRYFAGCSERSEADCRRAEPVPFVGSSRMMAGPLRDPGRIAALLGGRRGVDLLFDSLGGAVGRVPVHATAFCHRTALASVQVYGGGDARRSVSEVQAALAELVGSGGYVNYIDPEQPDWASAYYGPNLPRLREIAGSYDPERVFAFPQSITA
jgi:hypothetical protein